MTLIFKHSRREVAPVLPTWRPPPPALAPCVICASVALTILGGCKEEEKEPEAEPFVAAEVRFKRADVGFAPKRHFDEGTVAAAGELAPLLDFVGGLGVEDIDGDRDDDLLILGGDDGAQLFINDDGEFEEMADAFELEVGPFAGSPLFADLDADGDPDLLAAELLSGRVQIWLNEDGERFEKVSSAVDTDEFAPAVGVAAGDVDLDGDLDLFVARWAIGTKHDPTQGVLWLNNGKGKFEDRSDAIIGLDQGRSCDTSLWGVLSPTFADMAGAELDDDLVLTDLDVYPELLITRHPGPSQLFVNTTPQTGELSFELLPLQEDDRITVDQSKPPDWEGDLTGEETTRRSFVEANWNAVRHGALSSIVANVDNDTLPDWLLVGAEKLVAAPDCQPTGELPWLAAQSADAGVSLDTDTDELDAGAPPSALDGGTPIRQDASTGEAAPPDQMQDSSAASEVQELSHLDGGSSHIVRRRLWGREIDDEQYAEQAWLDWLYQPTAELTDAGTDAGLPPLAPVLNPMLNAAQAACVADFNNDLAPDVFQVTGTDEGGSARAHLHVRDLAAPRGFSEVAEAARIADKGKGRWVSCFDYDLDGDVDVFLMNADGGKLYENRLNTFDGESILGPKENANFFGVRIDPTDDLPIVAGTRVVVQWVNAETRLVTHAHELHLNAGQGSQQSRQVHFGLANITEIYRLTIEWPDGEPSTHFEFLEANDILGIRRTATE